jgi:hypothetical protein
MGEEKNRDAFDFTDLPKAASLREVNLLGKMRLFSGELHPERSRGVKQVQLFI